MTPAGTRLAFAALPAVLFAVYLSNGTRYLGADTLGSPYTTLSLMRDGDFDIGNYTRKMRPNYWFQTVEGGRVVSTYGFGAPLVALPIYEAVDVLAFHGHWTEDRLLLAGKLAGAAFSALAALLLAAVARRFAPVGVALGVGLVFGLASSTWSVSSQALWQHGPAALLVAGGLALVLWPAAAQPRSAFVALGALPLALSVWCRESLAAVVAAVAVYVFLTRRRAFAAFLTVAALVGGGLMALNAVHFGSPLLSAQRLHVARAAAREGVAIWDTPLGVGLYGQLASPSRGLFVYAPVFLLALVGAWRGRRDPERAAWLLLAACAALVVAPVLKWHWWWGGDSFGPRMTVDAVPFLALLLAAAWRWLARSRARLGLAAALLLFSIYVQLAGALRYDGFAWDERDREASVNLHPERLLSWRDSQLAFYLGLPPTRPQLVPWR